MVTQMDPKIRSLLRLCDDFSVIDAAILIADGDPYLTETYLSGDENGDVEELTRKVIWQQNGVEAAFKSLSSAVLHGRIQANVKIRAVVESNIPDDILFEPLGPRQVAVPIKGNILEQLARLKAGGEVHWNELRLETVPDWDLTTVNVTDLKVWLTARNLRPSFFFDDAEPQQPDFLDLGHAFFAPELALAVTAWQTVVADPLRARSPKAMIQDWLEKSGQAHWKGDEPLSNAAKERISTLINWERRGGAPRTGG